MDLVEVLRLNQKLDNNQYGLNCDGSFNSLKYHLCIKTTLDIKTIIWYRFVKLDYDSQPENECWRVATLSLSSAINISQYKADSALKTNGLVPNT